MAVHTPCQFEYCLFSSPQLLPNMSEYYIIYHQSCFYQLWQASSILNRQIQINLHHSSSLICNLPHISPLFYQFIVILQSPLIRSFRNSRTYQLLVKGGQEFSFSFNFNSVFCYIFFLYFCSHNIVQYFMFSLNKLNDV